MHIILNKLLLFSLFEWILKPVKCSLRKVLIYPFPVQPAITVANFRVIQMEHYLTVFFLYDTSTYLYISGFSTPD